MDPLYNQLRAESEALFERTRMLRRDFHRYPELGFQEVRTASIVARELQSLGLEVSTGIAETGVVALLEGDSPGPVGLVRFDMDALPITEQTGAEYASQNPGVMHACGHDGHTAVGLTVARLLHDHRCEINGTLKLVFQPAEEGLGGAKRMVAEGVLKNPKPDFCLALHVWNDMPFGWIGVTPGPAMAASETLRIHLTGKGGHGASPHLAIDPVLAAAHLITALQSIISRNVAPLKSAVISITAMHAGEAFNVIPQEVELKGTIRTFEPEVRKLVLERLEQIIHGVAGAMGCQVEFEVTPITPAVVNDALLSEQIFNLAKAMFPKSQVENDLRTMGSEDMAYMMADIPGCYFFLGSANPELGFDAPHHHPRFDIDERVLPIAAALMTAAALTSRSTPQG